MGTLTQIAMKLWGISELTQMANFNHREAFDLSVWVSPSTIPREIVVPAQPESQGEGFTKAMGTASEPRTGNDPGKFCGNAMQKTGCGLGESAWILPREMLPPDPRELLRSNTTMPSRALQGNATGPAGLPTCRFPTPCRESA
jgi:hypothetical protein